MQSTTTTIIFFAALAFAAALPARKSMVYLQQPAAQWQNGPQRLMYVQYVQQPSQTHARSTQAAEVLVAGDSVATGTYLKDCDHEESDVAAAGPAIDASAAENIETAASVDALEVDVEDAAATANDVSTDNDVLVEEPKVEIEIDATAATAVVDDEAKVPRELNFDAVDAAATVANDDVDEPAAAETPAPPATRYIPANKRVFVELEQPAVADIEEDETDDADVVAVQDDEPEVEEAEPLVVPTKPARRPVKKPNRPTKAAAPATKAPAAKQPLPAGTFFPINFGGTSGGAIAIANSFSTGEGGSATSHAIAYGSPDSARAVHERSSKKH